MPGSFLLCWRLLSPCWRPAGAGLSCCLLRTATCGARRSCWRIVFLFHLFVQGEQPRSVLLEQFRDSGEGVLLGSSSFWEGVDVIGDALTLVVIDKLPFAAPDDPVMEARSDVLRNSGGNPFTQLYLPQAVIALKQGAGRLIRDVKDRGALVICDPRIRTKSYGSMFRNSLPPMRQADLTSPKSRTF